MSVTLRANMQVKVFGLNRMDIMYVSSPILATYPIELNEVLILNPDYRQREGRYPLPPGTTEILGVEFSGTVAELGPGVNDFHVGDEVFGLTYGVRTPYAVCPAHSDGGCYRVHMLNMSLSTRGCCYRNFRSFLGSMPQRSLRRG